MASSFALPALCLSLLWAVPATMMVAAPAHAAGAEDLAAGLKKFDDGRKAYDGGQFEEALNDFNASLQLLASPNTRLYVGRCYRALGKVASAYTELKLAAREAQDRLAASGEKRYGATRDAANDEAAQLEVKVPRLIVAVPSNPPAGYVVKVNGRELSQAAWSLLRRRTPGRSRSRPAARASCHFKRASRWRKARRSASTSPSRASPPRRWRVALKNLPSGVALALDGQPIDPRRRAAARARRRRSHASLVGAKGYVPFH